MIPTKDKPRIKLVQGFWRHSPKPCVPRSVQASLNYRAWLWCGYRNNKEGRRVT